MISRVFISVFASLLLSSAASALAPPPESDGPDVIVLYDEIEERASRLAEEFGPDDETCPNELRTAPIVIPVAEGERLLGYAFATPRFCLARGVNPFQLDETRHFVVDQMVREAHRTPYGVTETRELDKAAAKEALYRVAVEIIGEGRIDRLDLLGSDVRYLR